MQVNSHVGEFIKSWALKFILLIITNRSHIQPVLYVYQIKQFLKQLWRSSLKQKFTSKISCLRIFFKVVNFSNENELNTSNLPTFLVINVTFNKSSQYTYLITMSGDVFFFKMTQGSFPIKTPIWKRSINAIVLKCYKIDINVNLQKIINLEKLN